MQVDLLEKVVSDVTGKSASKIVKALYGKQNVNEFKIAKGLQLTINQTRNILYKLSDAGLVSFMRKKDKRKGWYTYFWTLDIEKCLLFLKEAINKDIEQLKNQLSNRETKRFYVCKSCGVELNEENALLNEFTCKECGQVYELNVDIKVINDLKGKIGKYDKDLEIINKELEIIQAENLKKLVRRDAAEKRKKIKERAEKRKIVAKEKKKLEKSLKKPKKAEKKPKKKRL